MNTLAVSYTDATTSYYQVYETFIQALPEAAFLIEGDNGNLIAANHAAQHYLGRTQQWMHQSLQAFIRNPPRQLQHCLKCCSRTRIPMPITLSFSTNPSTNSTYEAILIEPKHDAYSSVIMLRHKGDKESPFIALNREVDKQKQTSHDLKRLQQSQAALRAVTKELKGRNYALEISNKQLHHEIEQRHNAEAAMKSAMLAAEQASQVKTTFLANMSHELRTPLNAILGFAQILARDDFSATKLTEYVKAINQNSEYLLTLINDILDLSKIEAGHVELHPQDFNLAKLLSCLSELFQGRAHQKGLNFIYEPLTPLPVGLYADERRLRQIMINLLSNAIKFTHQGGVIMKASYQDNILTLLVEDTGIGIDKARLTEIFLPFEQLTNCLNKNSGTGLGLAITQNLVKLMGGELHVTSTLNQGSTFSISLPVSAARGEIQVSSKDALTVIGYTGTLRRILIVDNKWENRTMLVNMLQPLGFEVCEAENGEQGLAKAQTWQPDVILTELVMPKLDGFAMVRQLRQQSSLQKSCIIGMSAGVVANEYELNYYNDSGFNDLIRNPIQFDHLLAKLAEQLNLHWVYQNQYTANTSETPAQPLEVESSLFENMLIAPSATTVQDLLELAKQGDIKGIIQYVSTLNCEEHNCSAQLFCNRIQELAKAFDEERICELLERCDAALQSLPTDCTANPAKNSVG